jgi:hypothetical protein
MTKLIKAHCPLLQWNKKELNGLINQNKDPFSEFRSEVDKRFARIEDAINWEMLGLSKKGNLELAEKLVAKAEWIQGLYQKDPREEGEVAADGNES